MVDGEHVRVEIGFEGGQTVNGFFAIASADQLQQALQGGGPNVVQLEGEDGVYQVVVARVAYCKRFARAGRVGFAAG